MNITTEDYGCVLFRFKGGARGSLWVSQVTAGRKNCLRYEIAGSKCALEWNSEIAQRDVDRPPRQGEREADPRPVAARRTWPAASAPTRAATTKAFRTPSRTASAPSTSTSTPAISRAPPLYPTFADGHHEIVLCEAILRSHREQKWVNVSRSSRNLGHAFADEEFAP